MAPAPRSAALALLTLVLLGASADVRSPMPDAVAALDAAFERRYACPITGVVDISTRKGDSRPLLRQLHVASKLIDERVHTYAIFQEPQYVRGMAFLGIEKQPGEEDEHFVYLPSLRKVRRIGGNVASDSFLGTDLTYHDFERQRVRDFEIVGSMRDRVAGEAVLRVSGKPRFHSTYDTFEYAIAMTDHAILESRYFRNAFPTEIKRISMPRAGMQQHGHCLVPKRIVVEDRLRKTQTELFLNPLMLDASLDDNLFTMVALEANRPIPGLASALSSEH